MQISLCLGGIPIMTTHAVNEKKSAPVCDDQVQPHPLHTLTKKITEGKTEITRFHSATGTKNSNQVLPLHSFITKQVKTLVFIMGKEIGFVRVFVFLWFGLVLFCSIPLQCYPPLEVQSMVYSQTCPFNYHSGFFLHLFGLVALQPIRVKSCVAELMENPVVWSCQKM